MWGAPRPLGFNTREGTCIVMYLGFLLLAFAVAAVVVGFLQRSKMKTILAAPFRQTGQALTGADAKGEVSFQGAIQPAQPGQQLIAPCSGQPCLYYEIEVKQEWEKHVQTEDGVKKNTGSDTAFEHKQGSMFWVNDGSGPIAVNATESVDAKLEKAFDEKKSYGWGDISFGGFTAHIHRPSDGEKHATATRCIEKILPANGDVFVLGKVAQNMVTKRDGMLGKLMLAREGRDALIGSTKRNMVIGFAAAGLLLPAGAAMAIFGEAPEAAADTCSAMKDDIPEPCEGRMYDSADVTFTWEVTEEADYKFSAIGTGKDPVMRLWPDVEVKDGGDVLFSMSAPDGDEITGQAHFKPGSYTIAVNDTHYGWAENLQGGAGFTLEIDQVPGTKVDSPAGDADEAEPGDEAADDKPVAANNNKKVTGTTVAAKTPATTKGTTADKADDQPEAKAEDKPEEKTEAKPEEKTEAKTEEKTEPPPETKTETKPAGKPILRLRPKAK